MKPPSPGGEGGLYHPAQAPQISAGRGQALGYNRARMALLELVTAYINSQALLGRQATVVVGVSGGPDSLCLLDLLARLPETLAPRLHVACLDHGLRPETAAEAAFVRAEAGRRGLPFHTQRVDTRAEAAARRQSLEEAARELRYAFLARTARSVGAQAIAVAHTADDQAETVLMHFLRGSGLAGLRGMQPKAPVPYIDPESPSSDLLLIRPLLATTRAEVEAYCADHSLRPVRDPSNLDTTFFRNRLRHELLPLLATYNPNIRAVLNRAAEVAQAEHAWLTAETEAVWQAIARPAPDRVAFAREGWRELSLGAQRALLRRAVRHLRPDRRDVDFTPIDQAVRFSRTARAGRACDVAARLRLRIAPDELVVEPWEAEPRTPEAGPQLQADGKLAAGWQFMVEPLAAGEWSAMDIEANTDRWQAVVDADVLSAPLSLRPRQPGDRLQPLGLAGRAKVSDLLINSKVPRWARDRWPLVVSGPAVVWLAGLRLAAPFRVTAATRRALRLRFQRVNDET